MVVSGDRSRRMSEMVSEIKRYKLPVKSKLVIGIKNT